MGKPRSPETQVRYLAKANNDLRVRGYELERRILALTIENAALKADKATLTQAVEAFTRFTQEKKQ
jgi:hypothetical protein